MQIKKISLDDIKNRYIEEIIQLYRDGYRLEGVFDSRAPTQTGIASITFFVETGDGPIAQAIIYVDGIYRGITDIDGKLKVSDLEASNIGTNHSFIIIRQGFNGRDGRVFLFPNIDAVIPILLTDLTIGKGSIIVQANCLGAPCEGVHIILKDQDIGMTGTDGTVLIEGLDVGYEVPFIARKEGYKDNHGLITIIDRFTLFSRLIYLAPALPNSGVVDFLTIESDGSPISDVQISVDSIFVGLTDNNGKLTAQNLNTDTFHSYIASKQGYLTVTGSSEIIIDIRFIPIIMAKSI